MSGDQRLENEHGTDGEDGAPVELDVDSARRGRDSDNEGVGLPPGEAMVDIVLYTPAGGKVARVGSRRRMRVEAAIQCYADMAGHLRGWRDRAHSAAAGNHAAEREIWRAKTEQARREELEEAFGRFRAKMNGEEAAELATMINTAVGDDTMEAALRLDQWVGAWWKRVGVSR